MSVDSSELQNPFQVGDRVVCVTPDWHVTPGMTGTVIFVNNDGQVSVEWDIHMRGHDCNGKCPSLNGSFALVYHLAIWDGDIQPEDPDVLLSIL